MKQMVNVWAFWCPVCGEREDLLGLRYFSMNSSPRRPIFDSTDSFPYDCGGRNVQINGQRVFLAEREIDQDEPLWATSMLLDKASHLKDSVERVRERHPNSDIMLDVARIWDDDAAQLLQIARFGSGKKKVEVLSRL
jgi:hypothetical protein